ncbi:MAG: hypothetical protein IJW70_02680 [Clostridia bacterium]|nr:hypothetical protein [Clostridia bacterium]
MKKTLSFLLSALLLLGLIGSFSVVHASDADSGVETLSFAKSGSSGTPYMSGLNTPVGYRFTVDPAKKLLQINVCDFATYSNNTNRGTFKLYRWQGDYASTVASEPLYSREIVNHADHSDLTLDIPSADKLTGELYFEVVCLEGTSYTPWNAGDGQAAERPGKVTGMQAYLNGQASSPFWCSITIADMVSITEQYPSTFAYDFMGQIPDVKAQFGLNELMMVEVSPAATEGYVTFTATGDDPYFKFGDEFNPTGFGTDLAYVVIKYRTTAEIGKGEFFTNRSGGAHWGNDGTHVDWNYNNDGEWHCVVIDCTTTAWGKASNETLYAFRFDPLASGASAGDTIDIAYIRFFASEENARAFGAAEDPSLKPKVTTYKIDFMVEGKLIYSMTYTDDGAPFNEPVVPHIPGKNGAWEPYTLENGGDLVVNAIYTDAWTEPETSPIEPEVQTNAPEQTTASEQNTEQDTEQAPTQNEGCKASIALILPALLLCIALPMTKRKEAAQ